MKPLVLFSTMAIACAGGLLALSYQGWRDDPSVVSSLNKNQAPVPVNAQSGDQQTSAPAKPQGSEAQQQTAAVAPETAKSDEAEPAPEAAKPAQPATGQETTGTPVPPTFDIVRIERDGSAVMAGRAAPGSKVVAMLNGDEIGSAETNDRGEWVIVPDNPIKAGDHAVTLSQATPDGAVSVSDQSVALTVPETAEGQPLIVLSETSKPSRVLQKPDTAPKPGQETQVAAAESQETQQAEPAKPEQQAKADQEATAPEPQAQQEAATTEPQMPAQETAQTPEPAETKPAVEAEQPAKPAQPADQVAAVQRQLTVDVVDYDDTGRTTFSGRAAPGSRVRVYVSGRFTGEAQADGEGHWSLTPSRDIAAGTHSLRADQVGGDGKVAQRIELPFLREQPERIAALQEQRKEEQAATSSAAEPQPQPQSQPQPAEEQARSEPSASEPAEPAATTQAEPEVTSEPEPQTAAADTTSEQQVAAAATEEAATTEGAQQAPRKGRVVIQPGNNLWQISRVIYGKGVQYTVIYEANKDQIRDPDLIYPGQIFETPGSQAPESIDPACRKPLAECEPEKQEAAQ